MAKDKVLVMGGIIIDDYILVDEYPKRGQDALISYSFQGVGGCAINVANTLKNLDCHALIVSAIGDDPKGDVINQYLKNQGFDIRCTKVFLEKKSGYCIILLDETGERTFLTYKGCEDIFEPEMVKDDLIEDIAFVYLTGYFLMNEQYHSHILETLDKIKAHGGKVVFDPGPLVEYIDINMLLSVLQRTYILVPNETELKKMETIICTGEGFHPWAFKNGVMLIIEKMGSSGVKMWTRYNCSFIPPYKVNSVDTTGAGDSFAGGLIYSLMNNYEITEAVRFSSACGAITTTFCGPHGKFNVNDVKQLIKKGEEIK